MNKVFQVTWNEARQVWVVASELASGDRPPRSLTKTASAALLLALVSQATLAQPQADALPQGGTVLMGQTSNQVNGNQMVINQTTERALTQWNSFNIGAQSAVRINQPGAGSSSVNRVLSTDPSQIYGSLSSNGQVVLINPAGVVFGPSARVDAGSIVASSLKLTDSDIAQGKLNFFNDGSALGTVTNQGVLRSGPGGYVALLGPRIENTGVIAASNGSALLGAGERISLSRGQDGLFQLSVDAGTLDAQIRAGGVIQAENGQALVSARAAGELSRSVINMDGQIEAQGISKQGGRIVLDSGVGGTTVVTGSLNASANSGKGGTVHLLGEQVGLFGQATVNASGAGDGGEVRVGGDYLGQGKLQTAKSTVLDSNAQIRADAGQVGQGGNVVVWSDDYTGMFGHISAKGGSTSGHGGFVETSSKNNLQAFGSVDTTASQGQAGQWLLDPRNVTIVNPGTQSIASAGGTFTPTTDSATISASSINTALNNGNNVIITTGASGSQLGDITVSSAISKTSGGNASLTLQADNSIYINNSIGSTSNALNMTFSAANRALATTGGVKVNGNLSSNGGNILIGGATGTTSQGIGYALNADASSAAVTLGQSVSILSGGGKIVINGHSTLPGSGNYSGLESGIYVLSGATVDSGGGNIFLSGIASGYEKTFGFGAEAVSGTTTTFRTGPVSGAILVDARNTLDVNGALGLTNSGSQARIQFIAPSVAHMLFKLNGSAQMTTFTIKPPCNSAYPNCGTLVVPGTNGSYLYAGYQAVSMPTESIYVFTSDASRAYNRSNVASGLTVTSTGAPVDFSTGGLSFSTASKNVGTYLSLNGAGSNPTLFNSSNGKSYAVAYYHGSYEITPIALTATAGNKAYDGTTHANLNLNGVLAGDSVSAISNSISFASKDVGSNILVSGTGMTLTGTDAQNYTLSGSTITALANITARIVDLSGSRVYNGGTDVDSGILNLGNLVDGEQLTLTGTGQMSNKNAGTGKSFQLGSLALGNGSNGVADNYTLVGGSRAVDISKADLSVTGLSATDKTYDANRTATLSGTAAVQALGSDAVSVSGTAAGEFDTKNVGTNKAVSVTGLSLSGADAGNYNLLAPSNLTANISKADLAVTGLSANNKTYDASRTATLSGAALVQALGSDVVSVSGTPISEFDTKNVGTNKAVAVSGLTLSGADAGNYNLVAPSNLTANISKADLAVGGLSAISKVYDTLTTAALSGTATIAAFGSDVVNLLGTAVGAFADKNVGDGKSVALSGLTLSGADAGNYNLVAPSNLAANISKADLAVTGLGANNKTYDATRTATLSGTAAVQALGSDAVSVSGTAAGEFDTKNVGTNKAVNVSGLSLSGADAGNYNLVAPSNLAANISKADLAVTGLSANNKTYDATRAVTLSGTAAVQALGSDAVSVSGTAAGEFDTKNVGTNKAVNVSGLALSGADAGNYNLVVPAGLTADIAKADLLINGLTATNKVYDATRAATLSGNAAVQALGGDAVSVSGTAAGEFDTKNVGTNKAVAVSGLALSGADAGNYNLVAPSNLTANISKADLAVTGLSANNKTYDATRAATLSGTAGVQALGSDAVSVSGTAAGEFDTRNVGTNKAVNVSGLALSGADAGNYNLVTPSSLTANIAKADLTISGLSVQHKTYDASRNANLAGAASIQALGSDAVSLTGNATGQFDTKNAGSNKAVTLAGLSLSGADASNYNLLMPTGLTADINKAEVWVAGLVAQDKTFDGTNTAQVGGNMWAAGVLPSDQVSLARGIQRSWFVDDQVGHAKAVFADISQLNLQGPDASNYRIAGLMNPMSASINRVAAPSVLPSPDILVVKPPKLPDAIVPTQTSGSQAALASNGSAFQVAALSPQAGTQTVVLKTAMQTDALSVSYSSADSLVLSRSKPVANESYSLQALPVFSRNSNGMKLDFKLKVEASGQDVSVQRIVSGDVPSQPDMSKRGSTTLQLKIQATADKAAEFEISTVDSALVITPVNQAGIELLTSNPNLVIGTSIVQGKNEQPDSFEVISAVVIPDKK